VLIAAVAARSKIVYLIDYIEDSTTALAGTSECEDLAGGLLTWAEVFNWTTILMVTIGVTDVLLLALLTWRFLRRTDENTQMQTAREFIFIFNTREIASSPDEAQKILDRVE
jgi:hypothetical protein